MKFVLGKENAIEKKSKDAFATVAIDSLVFGNTRQ